MQATNRCYLVVSHVSSLSVPKATSGHSIEFQQKNILTSINKHEKTRIRHQRLHQSMYHRHPQFLDSLCSHINAVDFREHQPHRLDSANLQSEDPSFSSPFPSFLNLHSYRESSPTHEFARVLVGLSDSLGRHILVSTQPPGLPWLWIGKAFQSETMVFDREGTMVYHQKPSKAIITTVFYRDIIRIYWKDNELTNHFVEGLTLKYACNKKPHGSFVNLRKSHEIGGALPPRFCPLKLIDKPHPTLVGGWATPLKNMKVN